MVARRWDLRGAWADGCTGQTSEEARDSTFHLFPPGHTGFLLFLKHTKPGPAPGPFHSPWDRAPHIPAQCSLHSYLSSPRPTFTEVSLMTYKNSVHLSHLSPSVPTQL